MKDKFCSNCGTKLETREKRKPIPPKLRHQILIRDGYRCRECGKSIDETSLEIDHIHPLSKGGPTTEDNLWVLCRDCNQSKKDDEWKDDEIEVTRNELTNLENQLKDAKAKLENSTDENEIRDYKFKIKKFETEYIPKVTNKLNTLIKEEKDLEIKRKQQQEENIRRENLFKDLYIELDGELLLELCDYYSLKETSNEDNLRILVDKHSEKEIYERINLIKKELKEEADKKALYEKLNNTMTDDEINLFTNEFSLKGSKQDVLNYLIDILSEDEIEMLKLKLIKKEEERLKSIKLKLFNKLLPVFDDDIILLFANEFSLENSKEEVINYLIDNYSEDKIFSIRNELIEQEQLRLETIRKEHYYYVSSILNDHDILLFAKDKNLPKDNVIDYLLDNFSINDIKEQKKDLHIKESKELLYTKLNESLDRIDIKLLSKSINNKSLKSKEEILNYLVESHSENEINTMLKSNKNSFNQNKIETKEYLNKNINEGLSLTVSKYYGFDKLSKRELIEVLINNFTHDEIIFMIDETHDYIKKNVTLFREVKFTPFQIKSHLIDVDPLFINDFIDNYSFTLILRNDGEQ